VLFSVTVILCRNSVILCGKTPLFDLTANLGGPKLH
jgi:hypothetical protein